MKIFFRTILVSLLFWPGAVSAEKLKLCYLEWGKLGGKDLPEKGLLPDAMKRMFEHAGYDVEVFIRPWNRCIAKTKQLDFDLVLDAWKGPTFDKDFDYLKTHHIDKIAFVVREDSKIKSGKFEDLAGKRVGYLATSGGLEKFYAKKDTFALVSALQTEAAMIRVLAKGRVDAIVSDPVQLLSTAEKLVPPIDVKLRVLEPPIQLNYAAALISKSHPDKKTISAAFEKSFRALVKTNMYAELEKLHGVKLNLAPLD